MSNPPLILKNPKGWFAAGAEVVKAIAILSDGAFKLFVYICLNACRRTAVLETTQTDLARNLNKAQGTIRSHLREMEAAGICRIRFTCHPSRRGSIQINEAFWPYQRSPGQSTPKQDAVVYISEIRNRLQARACVRCSFSVADEILARRWFDQGIALERVEQAILMGCLRKYVAWRNNPAQGPIGNLSYFAAILEEIDSQTIAPDYWHYLQARLQRIETLWKTAHSKKALQVEPSSPTSKAAAR